MSRIAILYNDVALESNDASDLDVLTQCRQISEGLAMRGHEVALIPCDLDLETIRLKVEQVAPDVVFNLVESLGGTDRLMAAVPLLLDAMNVSYTGSSAEAILRSGDKMGAKQVMTATGIPTPACFALDTKQGSHASGDRRQLANRLVIVKAIHEHASFAMENDAVMTCHDDEQLEQVLRERLRNTGRAHMIEAFIAGREFNLSLLEINGQPHVLAPAEIDFSTLPIEMPRIVNAAAKWIEDSVEYQATPRTFEFTAADQTLLSSLSELAIRCWRQFGLAGYARVDFRVDEDGNPFVLEVNANPCLSQDAGFVAAAERTGIGYLELIDAILNSAGKSGFISMQLTETI